MAQVEFGWSKATHMLAGMMALVANLWAFSLELRSLKENQVLVDRVALELDRIDRDLEAKGELPIDAPLEPAAIARGGMILGISAWMPYLYWVLVEWRGDFSKTSIHPWIEASLIGFGVWYLARGAELPAGEQEG